MRYLLTGVSHRSAPIELRERLALAGPQLEAALRALEAHPRVAEAMIVSTCNRVELLAAWEGDEAPALDTFLLEHFPLSAAELRPHLYQHRGEAAVGHLFRVACSLDSMVVGEPQILGQVKDAYTQARAAGVVRSELDRLLQTAFSVAKRVRTETRIASSSISVASVAVDLSLKIFGSLAGKRVLLVGAGKMSELAAQHLMARGAGALLVANRTEERAERLARLTGASVLPFAELHARAHEADIVLTSTGARGFLFRREHGQAWMSRRRGRPMFLVDIAVPRDIDPEVNRVEGIFLYDIDDLQAVASTNMEGRAREAAAAERIVAEEVERFARRAATLGVVPKLVTLREKVEAMRQGEHRRMQARLRELSPAQREAVEALTRGLANKILHGPLQAFREAAEQGDTARLEVLAEAFGLGQDDTQRAQARTVELDGGSTPDEPEAEPDERLPLVEGKKRA